MNYRIFCCHHLPLTIRKKYLDEQSIKYNLYIDYITGNEFGKDLNINLSDITNGELSLLLKHFDIYKIIIDEDLDYSIIIEDDIIIDNNTKSIIENTIIEKSDFDIIFFGGTYNLNVINPILNKFVYDGYNSSRCTHGYFINKLTAEKILNNKKLDLPIDHLLNYYIYELKLKCGWTFPHVLQKTVEGIEKSSLRN